MGETKKILEANKIPDRAKSISSASQAVAAAIASFLISVTSNFSITILVAFWRDSPKNEHPIGLI